jgi:DNA-directed RNA polymerase subunit alpha
MQNIFLPSQIEYTEGATPNEATLTIEPLYYGYGTTIANALRRVLLNSLPGAAVTAVKIKGADHEFMAIDGVMEDVLDITLNLKQLRMKVHTDEPVKLTLKKKGAGMVTAADFDKNADVDIVNPELHIAEISNKSTEFQMEVIVAKGMGFEKKESRERENKEVGLIEMDAIYTPIRHVGFQVENTRVGQITDYDKIMMTIETDGTLTPQEAVEKSSEILINHFNVLAGKPVMQDTPEA